MQSPRLSNIVERLKLEVGHSENIAVDVTFFSLPYQEEGVTKSLSLTMRLRDICEVEKMIDDVKRNGSLCLPFDPNGEAYMIPWPCGAVRIKIVDS